MAKKKEIKADGENEEMIDETTENQDPVERLFGIDLESTVENSEFEEAKTIKKEHVLKLSCHIDNNNNPINSL